MPHLRKIPRASSRDIGRSGSAMIFSKVCDISHIPLTTSHHRRVSPAIFAFPPPLCRGQDTRKRRMDLHFFNRRVSVVPSAYYHGHRCIYPRPPVVASVRASLGESCPCGLPERSIVTISSPSPERGCSYVVPGSPHIEASFIRVYLTR